jgi:hypothetical protein
MGGEAMSTLEMSKLKSLLQEAVIKLGAEGSVSSAAVIDEVRKNNPKDIDVVSRELQDGMMQRLISQLATRRPKQSDGQPDMFAGYPGVKQFMAIEIERDGQRTVEWKPIEKTTLRELAGWLASERKTSRTRRQRHRGMATMLRDLSKAAKGNQNITVEEAMALKRAHGGR